MLGIAGLVGAWWLRPDLWMVEHVEFEGAVNASTAELRHLVDLRNGTPMWRVDLERMARAARTHPWVEEASVHLSWPSTVRVALREHRAVALLEREGEVRVVGASGEAFLDLGRWPEGRDLQLPRILGVSADFEQRHPQLGKAAVRRALDLVEVLSSSGQVARDQIDEVVFSPSHGLRVRTPGVELAFGFAEPSSRLKRLDALVSSGLDLHAPTLVDLAPPTVAILRPRESLTPGS